MISIIKGTRYQAFGYEVESEIELPELLPTQLNKEKPDILIKLLDLSKLWKRLDAEVGIYNVKGNRVIFKIPQVAIFCIEEGNKILVSPAIGSDMDEIRLYVLGSCMGALLLQRKVLPLHGSAIAIEGKAYAFIGQSGAGKSTLASAFIKKGFHLLSDDVIAVSLHEDTNLPVVTPAYPQQKLWQDSLEQFGMDSKGYRPLFQRETKFSIPIKSKYHKVPLPLGGIFEIVKIKDGPVKIDQIGKLESLPVLFRHTFRHVLIHDLGLTPWHFDISTKVLNRNAIYRIQRPVSEFTAPEIVTSILNTIKREG